MTIKHLVLGGGGPGGIAIYGALKYLASNNFWHIENIESIYSTSIGSVLSILLILCNDWDLLDDFFTKRQWDKIASITPLNLINIWNDKGILSETIVQDIIKPFLTANDLSANITLKEFYDYSNIDIHMYTMDINASIPKKIDMSHQTHGYLELYKAISMSAGVPFIFRPIWDGSACCIDGGFINNFPLNDSIKNNKDVDEILAIRVSSTVNDLYVTPESNLYDYAYKLIDCLKNSVGTTKDQQYIKNIVICSFENGLNNWVRAVNDKEYRESLINIGHNCAKDFLDNY